METATKEASVNIKMRRLNARQEAFAQALARRASPNEAQAKAGYAKSTDEANQHANHPAIVARAQEITGHLHWGGSEDLAPVIDALGRLYEGSQELKSAAAIKERREILVQVARLKALLPDQQPTEVPAPPMSRAEWLATYARKTA